MIALDSLLMGCINTDDVFLSHRDLVDHILAGKSLTTHHTITFADLGTEPRVVIHKGAIIPILVSVKNRGSKVTTLVSGLDRFEIDAKLLMQACKIKMAAATSEVEEHGQPAVMIQGNQVAGIGKVLSEEFGVDVKERGKEWSSDVVEVKVGKGIKKK
jgi:translation initiation factor 1 (eIF-1/SUI1)